MTVTQRQDQNKLLKYCICQIHNVQNNHVSQVLWAISGIWTDEGHDTAT